MLRFFKCPSPSFAQFYSHAYVLDSPRLGPLRWTAREILEVTPLKSAKGRTSCIKKPAPVSGRLELHHGDSRGVTATAGLCVEPLDKRRGPGSLMATVAGDID